MRAIRLASAIATSIFGLRASIRASHDPSGAPLRAAHRTTAMTPVISNHRISFWPIFDVRPRRSLPPLECCRGVRPTHAAKSRPFENVSIGGAKVVIAPAVIGPMPGMVVSRFAVSSVFARRRSSVSKFAIFSPRSLIWPRSSCAKSRTPAGNVPSSPSTMAARRPTWAGPTGATMPARPDAPSRH